MNNSDLALIRPKELCNLLDIHISTLYRWKDEGRLPIEKVQIGPRAVGFRKSDVKAWLSGELETEPKKDVA